MLKAYNAVRAACTMAERIGGKVAVMYITVLTSMINMERTAITTLKVVILKRSQSVYRTSVGTACTYNWFHGVGVDIGLWFAYE